MSFSDSEVWLMPFQELGSDAASPLDCSGCGGGQGTVLPLMSGRLDMGWRGARTLLARVVPVAENVQGTCGESLIMFGNKATHV